MDAVVELVFFLVLWLTRLHLLRPQHLTIAIRPETLDCNSAKTRVVFNLSDTTPTFNLYFSSSCSSWHRSAPRSQPASNSLIVLLRNIRGKDQNYEEHQSGAEPHFPRVAFPCAASWHINCEIDSAPSADDQI